ncbi:hypothetical protein LguiB_006618 [Lonicera macranthoides]
MDPLDFASGGSLLGPKESYRSSSGHKRPPQDQESTDAPPYYRQQEPPQAEEQPRRPVIIHSVSPRVIHTAGDFMDLVQRLTRPSSSAAGTPGGDALPAERFASFEKNQFQRLAGTFASGSATHGGNVSPAISLV